MFHTNETINIFVTCDLEEYYQLEVVGYSVRYFISLNIQVVNEL